MTLRISYEIHTASTNNKQRPPQKFLDIFSVDKSVNGPKSRQLDGYVSIRRTEVFKQKSYSVNISIAVNLMFIAPCIIAIVEE